MTGLRSAKRQPGGFLIPNLAQNQHLRILAQQVPGCPCEIESGRLIHLGLHHSRDDLLHRILDRDDMTPTQVHQVPKAGLDGGRFPAAGRAGEQKHARSTSQIPSQLVQNGFLERKLLQSQHGTKVEYRSTRQQRPQQVVEPFRRSGTAGLGVLRVAFGRDRA